MFLQSARHRLGTGYIGVITTYGDLDTVISFPYRDEDIKTKEAGSRPPKL